MKTIQEILKEVEEYENGRWPYPHTFHPTKIIRDLLFRLNVLQAVGEAQERTIKELELEIKRLRGE